ncbi:hypothetical protein CU669_09105 [Paramagnetospirillum kuznetsovii]|uniref:Uncharacterized protein n=1 Tax=Paramagnetospirillum kuznetsovii TaxID=2053833 RepID=A0A364NYW8_9PROT|nr:hypothetical protein [Paramagnetospirillum kuznetsovii]RAU22271.1 hypothetical protein CU669_09105 [Paramagnetospirillum kuznetsovii]
MSGPKTSFEVQVMEDKHWVIAEMAGDEEKAKAFAESIAQAGNHSAVRVVKDYQRIDGTHTETVVLEKQIAAKGPSDPTLANITDAPLCAELEDFYGQPSRTTIGKLLRKYLDEALITPTELLHDAKEMKRFGDKGNLLFGAIDKVSSLQAKAAGDENSKARKDFLDKSWEQLQARAKEFVGKKPKTPANFAEAVKGSGGDPFTLRALMVMALLEKRSWFGKLDMLIAWAAEPAGEANMSVIDGVIADLMVPAQVIQDLLGFQSNLSAALCTIVNLVEGKAEAAKFAPQTFTDLNTLFAAGRLPLTREVLMARVMREIGGTNPLSRNDPDQEFEMFHKMLHRLVDKDSVTGGPPLAESLLQRGSRVLNSGGATVAAPQALQLMLGALSDGCVRLQFLLTLCASSLGKSMGEVLTEVLDNHVRRSKHIDQWIAVRLPPPQRMAALTAANKALRTCPVLADDFKKALADLIDDVMVRYLTEEGIIEKVDKPDDPLAARAVRLVKFCGAGVLIEGKSLNMAKARVIEHLRQKQFEEKFVASCPDPSQGEKSLRDFHKLLVECGFG